MMYAMPGMPAPTSARKKSDQPHSTGLEVKPLKCALCEQEFQQLLGVTFLKAVAEQRQKFGDDELLKWCTRRGFQKMYESASLCVFCSQFFDKNSSTE